MLMWFYQKDGSPSGAMLCPTVYIFETKPNIVVLFVRWSADDGRHGLVNPPLSLNHQPFAINNFPPRGEQFYMPCRIGQVRGMNIFSTCNDGQNFPRETADLSLQKRTGQRRRTSSPRVMVVNFPRETADLSLQGGIGQKEEHLLHV
jgi:hypothetical protein